MSNFNSQVIALTAGALFPAVSLAAPMDTVRVYPESTLVAGGATQGRWLCPECAYEIGALGTNQPVSADSEILQFIVGTVNAQLFSQIPGVTGPIRGLVPGDRITICDGNFCVTLFYHASGKFFLATPTKFIDTRQKYRNGIDSAGDGTSPVSGVRFSGGYYDGRPVAECPIQDSYYRKIETWDRTTYRDGNTGEYLGEKWSLFTIEYQLLPGPQCG